ncbi:unnamed protein product, partial [Phaeothamnion confervicola]
RQANVLVSSSFIHITTRSSPFVLLVTFLLDMLQAAGAAYALKLSGSRNVAMCYFGDGAASERDFHAALNFAATLDCPVVFFCRNNGYAISTPTAEQYRGDGIVSRAPGYGVHGVRVDGNDALAVYAATAAARELAADSNRPVLLEAMTYRVGHHSTSDDWSRYRDGAEVKRWQGPGGDGVARFRLYLERRGLWGEGEDRDLRDKERMAVMLALETAEKKGRPPLSSMFEDVYRDMPPALQEQQAAMVAHIAKYPESYPKE